MSIKYFQLPFGFPFPPRKDITFQIFCIFGVCKDGFNVCGLLRFSDFSILAEDVREGKARLSVLDLHGGPAPPASVP